MSIQGGLRLTEAIRLMIHDGKIWGTGSDIDGEFELSGTYRSDNHAVHLVRRYTRTTDPQGGVGVPYDYFGVWDGMLVHGFWEQRDYTLNGGPFEMWPNREEDREELALEVEEFLRVGP